MSTIYYTGCSLDGFIATPEHSLDWLLSRDIDEDGPMHYAGFRDRIGASIMGATTWQWILDHDEEPWGDLATYVMTHRTFEPVKAVTFTAEAVEQVHAAAVERAGGKDVWLVGGGELVGTFHDAGLLDEVWIQFAPVTLGPGDRSCHGTSSCGWRRSRATATSSARGTPWSALRQWRSDLPLPQGPRHGERLRAAARPRRHGARRPQR
ncbi:dihydrofolate reductase family protein [Nocardioides piscis]|uniref:dihydrofolate reductase family protein n=1 Tax=Nocardioides piscis TaxID=2714938 RepID=UPI001FE669D5|nr:dihydrofolate reductase family protein [Nocardioides piscis]